MKIVSLILVVIAAFFAGVNVSGQTTSIGSDTSAKTSKVYQIVGEVVSLDTTTRQVSIKTKENEPISVLFDANTDYKRVPPGETTLSKAVAVTLADITIGDQVYARGMTSENGSR